MFYCLKINPVKCFSQQVPVVQCIKSKADHLNDAELHLVYLQKLSEEERVDRLGVCTS